MGFKAGKSFKDMNRRLDVVASDIVKKKVPSALFTALTIGAGVAKTLTPVKSSNLINSQYTKVDPVGLGWHGVVGYTANYAAAVHSMPGTLLGNPKYWQPRARPQFLLKAFVDNKAEIDAVFKRGLKI